MCKIIVLSLAALVAGCSSLPSAQPVSIVASDFCQIVDSKLSWDTADTPATIQEIRSLDAKWDRTCGKKKPWSLF
jgi:hypothetical protein